MRELYHDPIDLRKVSELVRRDASLTYRLLRLVNSPIYGIYQEVRSVRLPLRRWAKRRFAACVAGGAERTERRQPSAILHMALVRARFCELAAASSARMPTSNICWAC